MHSTDLTVAAIVERNGRFLLVDEYSSGRRVLSQPGGHIEAGESPEDAVNRETLEETGCIVECGELIGSYLWTNPHTRQQFLRIMFAASYRGSDATTVLDSGIIGPVWLSPGEIESRGAMLRSPAVLKGINDYLAGRRQKDGLPTDMLPLQRNVHKVIATADRV